MRELRISNSALVALVDDEDYPRCNKVTWNLNNKGYAQGRWSGELVFLHRFVLWIFDKQLVDHEDRNPLNCQKYNLRPCNKAQNMGNSIAKQGRQFKGTRWHFRDKKWSAQIGFNGKTIHLGTFDVEISAAKAYDIAALQYFGEFARINFNLN